jgi:single-strand DNA-binding protein
MSFLNENLVVMSGRAIADAELRPVGSSQVCSFRLVTNKRIKKADGEYVEKSCFIDCEAWGKRADYGAKYIKKGSPVRVMAELEQDEWMTDGKKRQKHKLYVNDIRVARNKDDSSASSDSDSAPVSAGAPSAEVPGLPF